MEPENSKSDTNVNDTSSSFSQSFLTKLAQLTDEDDEEPVDNSQD